MPVNHLVFSIFIIFAGAAVLSTVALYTRQSLLVAYMVLGVALGPWGLKWVANGEVITQIGDVGIIFLLFLLGLHLHPQNLWHMLRKVTWVALISSLVFAGLGYVISWYFGYTHQECLIIGAAMMFSSTIIGLKLLPTSVMHHQHTGEVMISVLLMQDLIAITVLLLLHGARSGGLSLHEVGMIAISLPGIMVFAFLVERFILVKLIARFDRVREYIFLVSIAWCLGMAQLSHLLGLSDEIGAFIAGVSLAASPIALYIAESLKPLRDFFLVMFFFSVGASFDLNFLPEVIIPASILAMVMLVVKPLSFRFLLHQVSETKKVAWEVGFRLGQISEFSLLVAYLAANTAEGKALLSPQASYLIQAATIITFVISSYVVVQRYPTPMGTTDKLRQD